MNWFRIESNVHDHPKVYRFAEAVGIDPERALGRLLRFWACVAKYAETGDLSHVSDQQIADWFRWKKPPAQLVALLIDTNLIDPGTREVHGWWERNGHLVRDRQRKSDESEARNERAESNDFPRNETGKNEPPAGVAGVVYCDVLEVSYSTNQVRLHAVWLEATGRNPKQNRLTTDKAQVYAELEAWAGSVEAAERGIRKVAASDFHRGNNPEKRRHDRLTSKPFRTAVEFRGWCEEVAAPVATESNAQRIMREAVAKVAANGGIAP